MKNLVFIVFMLAVVSSTLGQKSIGIISGINKTGFMPEKMTMCYGLNYARNYTHNLGIEMSAMGFRSQFFDQNIDFMKFMPMFKVGYFGKKFGAYGAEGICINFPLNHLDHNYTYFSVYASVGFQFKINDNFDLDTKIGYDLSASGAYLIGNNWIDYNGFMSYCTLRYKLKK